MSRCQGDDTPEVTDNEASNASDDNEDDDDDDDDDDESASEVGLSAVNTDPSTENYNKWKAQGYWTLTFQRTYTNQTETSFTFSVETNVEPHPLLKQLLAHYSSGPASRHLIAPVVEAEREYSPEQHSESEYLQCPQCQEAMREINDNQSNTNNQNQEAEYTRGSRGFWSMTFERTFSDMSKSGFSVESDIEPHPLVEKLWHYYEDSPVSNFLQPKRESEAEPRQWINRNCQPMEPERGPRGEENENINQRGYPQSEGDDDHDQEDTQEPEVVQSEEENYILLEPVIVDNRGQPLSLPQQQRQRNGIQALLKMENILKEQDNLVDKQREALATHQNALAELEEEINRYIENLAVTKSDLKRCRHNDCDMVSKWRALGKALENYKKGLRNPACSCNVNWTAFAELKESVTNVFGEGALHQQVASPPNGNPPQSSSVGSRSNSFDGDWWNF